MRHSTFLEVNLKFLQENFFEIAKKSKASILPMVKADAYGNGLIPVSRTLVEDCGVKTLGCASLGEALYLFNQCPELKAEAWIFSDTEVSNPDLVDHYANYPITPILHQPADLETALTHPSLKKMPLAIKMNTGMNRLGFSSEEIIKFLPRLKNRGVKHLLTHFACSYYPLKDGDKTHRQMAEFNKIKKIFNDANIEVEGTSVANSGAIEQSFGLDESHLRPGLMLYGPPSVEPRIWEGHQISKFVTKILKTFSVKKGIPVGYGINVTGEDAFIIIIPIGYADWSITTASGAAISINGYKGKIFARVNMDMSFIIFDPSVAGKLKAGETVEIWGHDNQVITDLAFEMKTIPYQLMCAVSNRIPRIYKVN